MVKAIVKAKDWLRGSFRASEGLVYFGADNYYWLHNKNERGDV